MVVVMAGGCKVVAATVVAWMAVVAMAMVAV